MQNETWFRLTWWHIAIFFIFLAVAVGACGIIGNYYAGVPTQARGIELYRDGHYQVLP